MKELIIDTNFKVYTDAKGGDPDSTSKTLKNYHKILWNKTLPNGTKFELTDKKSGKYLYHNSELGEFNLGSDAITHSYRNQKRKQWLVSQISKDVDELFEIGSTIGAYTLFPKNKIDNKFTINQARGINSLIDDRFDLTLECIRLFYTKQTSPLFDTLLRYENFFKLFGTFKNYVNFFLLDDLLDDKQQVKFYLPFDDFNTKPNFRDVDDYLIYKNKVTKFIQKRNDRINKCTEKI
ncbi:MAG: hypothetical protein COA97_00545 [Flavobacteriales bacterium]|nr:MAG: hypothetical protein COA97_00545 [Flavobacteriales bacterium]